MKPRDKLFGVVVVVATLVTVLTDAAALSDHSQRRKRTATSACAESDLASLAGFPSFLEYQTFALVNDILKLRCTGGRAFSANGGYFDLTCGADGNWVVPDPWPLETSCLAGDECTFEVAFMDLPGHLQSDSTGQIPSGTFVDFACATPNHGFKLAWSPYRRECFHGQFLDSEKGPGYPPAEACAELVDCSLAQLSALNPPLDVLETTVDLSSSIAHGGTVDYHCLNGKKLDSVDLDPDGDDKISLYCDAGIISAPPQGWPAAEHCRAECTSLTVPAISLLVDPGTIDFLERDTVTLTCQDNTHYVNDEWMHHSITLTCQSDGTFNEPDPWPICDVRPNCAVLPVPDTTTGLKPVDSNVQPEVTESAGFNCIDPNLGTDDGMVVYVPCGYTVDQGPHFILPSKWNTQAMTCRVRKECSQPQHPPESSGLKREDRPDGGYFEFDSASYTCLESEHKIWEDGVLTDKEAFEVSCIPPGNFESSVQWPLCDVLNPPKCDQYLVPPADSGVSIIEEVPVLPLGKVYYKCDNPDMISNLGDVIPVECEKNTDTGTVYFKKPAGWDNLRCRSAKYPDFDEPPCTCLGDIGLSAELSNKILDNVCRQSDAYIDKDCMVVPFKKRCGVSSLADITAANKCYCYEKNDNGVDFGIWTIGDLSTYKYDPDYVNPESEKFISLQDELQIELDRLMLESNPLADKWRFVRTYVMGFKPGRPLACTADEIDIPDLQYGLELKESKTVQFGEYVEYQCIQSDYVTNDGLTFKVPCQEDGKFKKRHWLHCRPRRICYKPPPLPPPESGLARSSTRDVLEFEHAVYECETAGHVVPGTEDGTFQTPCKRTGDFEQAVRIEWPTGQNACRPKPDQACGPVPEAPDGYTRVTPKLHYMHIGEQIVFKCSDPDLLIGTSATVSFICGVQDGESKYLGWPEDLPLCREPTSCDPLTLPDPPEESGLKKPLQSQHVLETLYVEYECGGGENWVLRGLYDTSGYQGAQIGSGMLRLYCQQDGTFGSVGSSDNWPPCRDKSITHCLPENFPAELGTSGLQFDSSSIPVLDELTVSCPNGEVTEHFGSVNLPCDYDGYLIPPDSGFTPCRPAVQCPASPTPPGDSFLLPESTGVLTEFQIQVYNCEAGYTLEGVMGDLIEDGEVKLPCKLDAGGAFIAPASWPSCLPIATECPTPGAWSGFVTGTTTPVPVGTDVTYSCAANGQVTDLGAVLISSCTESGIYTQPDSLPICREPSACNVPPVPKPESGLILQVSNTPYMEWGFATYKCPVGSALTGKDEERVQCGLNGMFPQTDQHSWPICRITHCLDVVSNSGFTPTSTDPIAVGEFREYNCANPNQIAEDSIDPLRLECFDTGQFAVPNPWPTCRSRVDCAATLPQPPVGSYLELPPSGLLQEFDYAKYSCKAGAHLNNVIGNPDVVNGQFQVQCQLGGGWEDTAQINWPQCFVEYCANVPESFPTPPLSRVGDEDTVLVSEEADYKCAGDTHVTDIGPIISLECLSDGTLASMPSSLSCRPPGSCTSPPTPGPSTFLLISSDSVVTEFESASYSCQPGAHIMGDTANVFEIDCSFTSTGNPPAFPDEHSISWPTCTVDFCTVYDDLTANGLAPVDNTEWVAVGDFGSYECFDNTKTLDSGSYTPECGSDGQFILNSVPTCRDRLVCPDPPPLPTQGSNFQDSASTQVMEFDFAEYSCVPGAYLLTDGPNILNGKFSVECENGGSFPTSPTFPTCTIVECVTLPNIAGFVSTTTVPLSIGGVAEYTCETAGEVTPNGAILEIPCMTDGNFDVPATLPACQAAEICVVAPPTPSGTSGLNPSGSVDVTQYNFAVYECPSESFLVDTDAPSIVDGQFLVMCEGTAYEAVNDWPTCKKYKCDIPDAPDGYVTVTAEAFVYANAEVKYKCATDGEVTPDGEFFYRTCQTDGTLSGDFLPCAAPATECTTPPTPPADRYFEVVTTAAVVLEFQLLTYHCQSGRATSDGETTFAVLCGSDGQYPANIEWPQCELPTCAFTLPAIFTSDVTITAASVNVRQELTLSCADVTHATEVGLSVKVFCDGSDGVVKPVDATHPAIDTLTCSAVSPCTAAVPDPPNGSNLEVVDSTVSNEYDAAVYQCVHGFALVPNEPEGIDSDGKYHLVCEAGGTFDSSWPSCLAVCNENNLMVPNWSGLEPVDAEPYVLEGSSGYYKCTDQTMLPDSGTDNYFAVTCGSNGKFETPASWPKCRKKVKCPFTADPPTGLNWIRDVSNDPVLENDDAVYRCASGHVVEMPADHGHPPGTDPDDNYSLKMKCENSGHVHVHQSYSKRGWPRCVPDSSKRKKRGTECKTRYEVSQDIDYTLKVIVEMQFMFSESITEQIETDYGITKSNATFGTAIVELFHSTIMPVVLGDGRVKAGMTFFGPFKPACEQPTNAPMGVGKCSSLSRPEAAAATAVCSIAILEGAWISSLGFSFQQQMPKWSDSDVVPYNTPVGTEIHFYCDDKLKRPRKDEWDLDEHDGILSAYCTHEGEFSITMNPADWDRCRRLCPALKPSPPVVPGAQLVTYDSASKWESELWEDEEINYGCENISLVINNEKGVKSVSYKCGEGGEYLTPSSGDVWPQCTPSPIDPLIIQAVREMVAEFDVNMDYKAQLTESGDDIPFIKRTEGIIAITVPLCSGIVLVIILTMCCTRANSLICVIFEPQA